MENTSLEQRYSYIDPVTLDTKEFKISLPRKCRLMAGGIEHPEALEKYMSHMDGADCSYKPTFVSGVSKETGLISFGKYDIDVHHVNGSCMVSFKKDGTPVVNTSSEDCIAVKKEMFVRENINTATDFVIKRVLYKKDSADFSGYVVAPKSSPDTMFNVYLTNLMDADPKRKAIRLYVKPDEQNGFKLIEQYVDYNVINKFMEDTRNAAQNGKYSGKVIYGSAYGVSLNVMNLRVYLSANNMDFKTLKAFVAGKLATGAAVENVSIDGWSDSADIIGFQVASADRFMDFDQSVKSGKKDREVYCFAEVKSGYKLFDIKAEVTYYLPKAVGKKFTVGETGTVTVESVNTANSSCVFAV